MAPDPRERIETLRTRIENGEREVHCDDCRGVFLEYSRRVDLIQSEEGNHRHQTVLRNVSRISQQVECVAAVLDDRSEAEGARPLDPRQLRHGVLEPDLPLDAAFIRQARHRRRR